MVISRPPCLRIVSSCVYMYVCKEYIQRIVCLLLFAPKRRRKWSTERTMHASTRYSYTRCRGRIRNKLKQIPRALQLLSPYVVEWCRWPGCCEMHVLSFSLLPLACVSATRHYCIEGARCTLAKIYSLYLPPFFLLSSSPLLSFRMPRDFYVLLLSAAISETRGASTLEVMLPLWSLFCVSFDNCSSVRSFFLSVTLVCLPHSRAVRLPSTPIFYLCPFFPLLCFLMHSRFSNIGF